MRKVNDHPLIYRREDGTCVLFVAYHYEAEEQKLIEVTGTLDYCLGYYDGFSHVSSGISAVDPVAAGEVGTCDSSSQECANRGSTWEDGDVKPIVDYFERVELGGTVPSGECPACGALCYPVNS